MARVKRKDDRISEQIMLWCEGCKKLAAHEILSRAKVWSPGTAKCLNCEKQRDFTTVLP